MKKTYSAFALLVLIVGLTSTKKDPSNPDPGNTGAPGETTCAKSNCHSGGSFTGTVTIAGVPDTILANTTYAITLTHASGATKAGFQLTCLDNANAKSGTLTTATGVNVTTSGGRQYARQSAAKTISGGLATWTFSWKSPATIPAAGVTFYFSSLAANGNGKESGDNVLVGTKKAVAKNTLSSDDLTAEAAFAKIYPTILTESLTVENNDAKPAELTIYDQNGRALARQTVQNGRHELSVEGLPIGVFVAKIASADGRSVTARLIKN